MRRKQLDTKHVLILSHQHREDVHVTFYFSTSLYCIAPAKIIEQCILRKIGKPWGKLPFRAPGNCFCVMVFESLQTKFGKFVLHGNMKK